MQQLTPNTLLQGGKYRIEKVLGQGSFGITYLAVHTSLNRNVAIKEFFMKELNSRGEDGSITGMTEGSLSYNYGQKFKKEALNLASLHHSNIVRVTDSFEENGTFYYVMDYIEGMNLNEYIKRYTISQDKSVEIIKQVAEAVKYMHEEKHMLHLDIKPGNIMRRKGDGHIFLIDFGLSKHYDNNGAPETSTTIGLGTPGYAPIEQANQAKHGEFRPTIDVYALGATLYKLLTRETPPPASELVSEEDMLANTLGSHSISDKIATVICNAMQPSVKKRTQTVRKFIASLSERCNTFNDMATMVEIKTAEETIVDNSSIDDVKDKQPNTKKKANLPKPPVIKETQKSSHKSTTNSDKNKDQWWEAIPFIVILLCAIMFYKMSDDIIYAKYAFWGDISLIPIVFIFAFVGGSLLDDDKAEVYDNYYAHLFIPCVAVVNLTMFLYLWFK